MGISKEEESRHGVKDYDSPEEARSIADCLLMIFRIHAATLRKPRAISDHRPRYDCVVVSETQADATVYCGER